MISSTSRRILSRSRLFSTTASAPEAYSAPVKFFHWAMGFSMIASTGLVLVAQQTQDKEKKSSLMFYHKSFGLLAAGMLVPRVFSRVFSQSPPPLNPGIQDIITKITHLTLYGLVIALPVTGVAMGSYSGFGLPFFVTTIPSIGKDPSISKPAFDLHKTAGQIFEYLVPVHVGAAFLHALKGEAIFARIIGGGSKAGPKVPKA